jgi:hypothetical protein
MGTGGFFPAALRNMDMKLTINLHLVLRLRIEELYLNSPIHHHGMVLNSLSMCSALYRAMIQVEQYLTVMATGS